MRQSSRKFWSPYQLARPAKRRLNVYSIDPSLNENLGTIDINETQVEIPWESCPGNVPGAAVDGPAPGPCGEYLDVIDVDPATGCFYEPIDLNHPYLLALGGLSPSDGHPQFHQQMVYAVAMRTIGNFEMALGRSSLWSPRLVRSEDGKINETYVGQLRIYPHALREANAYYSPDKKALLFGYFEATEENDGSHMPGGMVFTCLSHDIVAHEVTHALLDGMHRRLLEPTNPDVLAFHEAFADIVALFQHFSLPGVLEHQIGASRADLRRADMLGELAVQFGIAIGRGRALRSAIKMRPDPSALSRTYEPHDRGAILVAAVFDAFIAIYERRTADLVRLATEGTGILPEGALHPDLIRRMANEAAKTAQHVMTMCIRALDYLPPVDLTFGDYLRALITADADLYASDDRQYRVAFIEAFRRRGIYPEGVRSLSEEGLRWETFQLATGDGQSTVSFGENLTEIISDWSLDADRETIYTALKEARGRAHRIVERTQEYKSNILKGIDLFSGKFEVHSIRPIRRTGPSGDFQLDMVIEITQKRQGFFNRTLGNFSDGNKADPDFWFRGGCTLIVDLAARQVRYCIYKDVNSQTRYKRVQDFLGGIGISGSLKGTYFSADGTNVGDEILAFVHRNCEGK